MNKTWIRQCLCWGLLCIGSASAMDYRVVIVNDRQLSAQEIWQLEQLHGETIPSGSYWLDWNTGLWGYKGGPAQGVLGQPNLEYGASTGSSESSGQIFEDTTQDFCLRHGCSTPW